MGVPAENALYDLVLVDPLRQVGDKEARRAIRTGLEGVIGPSLQMRTVSLFCESLNELLDQREAEESLGEKRALKAHERERQKEVLIAPQMGVLVNLIPVNYLQSFQQLFDFLIW